MYKLLVVTNISFVEPIDKKISNVLGENNMDTCVFIKSLDEFLTSKVNEKYDKVFYWINFEELFPDFVIDYYQHPGIEEKYYLQTIELVTRMIEQSYNCKTKCWLTFEDAYLQFYRVNGSSPICNYLIDRINIKIVEKYKGELEFIDLKSILIRVGFDCSYNLKWKLRWNAPYSQNLITKVIAQLSKKVLIEYRKTPKCIVIDCDNVLWGGILSEEGIGKIRLGDYGEGKLYVEFQKFLLSLYYQGIILAVCSKNDYSEVRNVFDKHSAMKLKQEHISCMCVNWDNKPNNICLISQKLGIGLDSILFIDDSNFEIEAVKMILPQVKTILFDKKNIFSGFEVFNLDFQHDYDNIMNRHETYKTNIKREDLRRHSETFEDYLIALEMDINVHLLKNEEISRVSELSLRTNRCTNGKRFTIQQLSELSNDSKNIIYSISLKDKFSDLGIVGSFLICDNYIYMFCLSCRALGRGVEENVLKFISDNYDIEGIYVQLSDKNKDIIKKFKKFFPKSRIEYV